jgi:predicted amidohydrolase
MKISIAQIEAIKGDIEKNLDKHLQFIEAASSGQSDLIMFPELSLTGYEPELAKELATHSMDDRLTPLQKISDEKNIIIGAGLPTYDNNNLFISMIIFQPGKERITYSKQYLYPTEKDIFTPGNIPCIIPLDKANIIAPAICYELSNKEHAAYAYKMNATIYIASVLNSVNGVDADIEKLSNTASTYKMTTFMSNYIGESGGYECAGKSSIWNTEGELIAQLDNRTEGILTYNTLDKSVETRKR